MTKINSSPNIRFKNFTNAWEQRRLEDIADRYDNLRIPVTASNRIPGPTPYYGANGIQDFVEGYTHEGEFVLIAEDGANDLNNYPVHLVRGKVWVNNHAHVISAINNIASNQFIVNSFKTLNLKPYLTGGSRAKLNADTMMKLSLKIPLIEEQEQIGSFFKELDNLITLHQRKLKQLQTTKKTFLNKLFPKNKNKTPEIRFDGYSDAWEQRKLGDITKRVTRKNKNLESDLPLTISAELGLIDQREYFNRAVASRDLSNYLLVKNGEFAYNKSYSEGYPMGAIKRLNDYDYGVLSTLYIVFKPTQISSDYLEKYYDGNQWHREVSKYAAEGARNHGLLNISPSDFFETIVKYPNNIKEQEQIGFFFKELDKLITLHQRKVESLEMSKKYYLKHMFV